jgi:hypothetical protein
VIVGASADLMLQPYGALLAGCFAGTVSTLGYQVIQPALLNGINLHDSCGVHNLHGMPGILGGLLSVLLCWMATPSTYGSALYLLVGNMAPPADSEALAAAQALLPGQVEAGPGHSASYQAGIQLTVLGISLAVAIGGGLIAGIIINIPFLTSSMNDTELFDDFQFWQGPDEAEPVSAGWLAPEEADQVAGGRNGWQWSEAARRESLIAAVLNGNGPEHRRVSAAASTTNGELAEYYRRMSAASQHQQPILSTVYQSTSVSPYQQHDTSPRGR